MDGVHSGPAGQAPLALAAATPRRAYTPAERIFGSMRFGAEHGVVPMAEQLQGALAARGIELCIINMTGGGDIDTAVFRTIEACDTFLVFGSAKYGEHQSSLHVRVQARVRPQEAHRPHPHDPL